VDCVEIPGAGVGGTETNRAVFLNYCTDPIIKTQGQDVEIQFNFFNPWGGVELWSLGGKFSGFLDITNTTVKTLKENGTFYYPLER
jgi:hypothetical protein